MLNARYLVGMAAIGMLLLGSGCQSNNTTASTPTLMNTGTARPDESTGSSSSSVGAHRGITIYTTRSQAEVDAIYNIPAPVIPIRPKSSTPSSVMALQSNDGAVAGEDSWNVQVTREWRHIVVHHSASNTGSAAIFDRAHKERGWDGLGYHFVIGNGSATGDGQVEVGYRWARQMQGAHAGNSEYNDAGIGVCLVGDFQNGGHPSANQMASLRRLVRFLQAKTGVPTYEVIGHGNVPNKSTQCPGQYLDIAAFRQSLGNATFDGNIHVVKSTGPLASRVTGNTRSSSHSSVKVSSTSGASMP